MKENSWFARRAARKLGYEYVAMVLGHTIHLHNTTIDAFFARPSWVCHELKHVEQFERHGSLLFLVKYAAYHLQKGYWNNPFEIEARACESNRDLLRQYDLSAFQAQMKEYEIVG